MTTEWVRKRSGTSFIVCCSTDDAGIELLNHPFAITYDVDHGCWSQPVQLGKVSSYDHHYAPIIWRDSRAYLHVLYHCHGRDGGIHLVSENPDSIDSWRLLHL